MALHAFFLFFTLWHSNLFAHSTTESQEKHFNRSLALAEGTGFKKKDVDPSLRNAETLIRLAKKLASLLPPNITKKNRDNIELVEEFFQEFKSSSGIASATEGESPIAWKPERWTSITSSLNSTLVILFTDTIAHLKSVIKTRDVKKSLGKGYSDTKKRVQESIPALESLLTSLKRPQALEQYVPLVQHFAQAVQNLLLMMRKISIEKTQPELERTQSAPAILPTPSPPAKGSGASIALPRRIASAPTMARKKEPSAPPAHKIRPSKPLPALPRNP